MKRKRKKHGLKSMISVLNCFHRKKLTEQIKLKLSKKKKKNKIENRNKQKGISTKPKE